ncbi:unnamed protein product [Calypogeia fissa]
MAMFQMLVRNLDGNTRCLRFTSREVSFEDVKAKLAASEGVPGDLQRLVSGTRELGSGSCLVAGADGFFPSCTLLLRLRGGKGGFGSLLRGAATKAGQKKTSNFDACRDMSGRRLRHVNAEKKLKEWKADAKERELEKTAEDFLKKQRKVDEEDKGMEKELQKFRKESLEVREEIGSAVQDGLAEGAKLAVSLKRKKVLAVENEVKRKRTWSPDIEEDEDSDEEDEAGPSSSNADEPGSSGSDKGEASASCCTKDEAGSSSSDEAGDLFIRVQEQESSPDTLIQSRSSEAVEITLQYPEPSRGSSDSSSGKEVMDQTVDEPTFSSRDGEGQIPSISNGTVSASPLSAPSSTMENNVMGPLDLGNYRTSKDLEVLGLERLKSELLNRGLKCGGSLTERAARLFLLKTTPLEKLDKSLFSKPIGKATKKKSSA